jgi:hypothetical protein
MTIDPSPTAEAIRFTGHRLDVGCRPRAEGAHPC